MPCIYNLPQQERFCQFCSAACDERPALKVYTTTNTANPMIEENHMPMDLKDQIIEKVREMRRLQREFFRTHNSKALQASKDIEKVVDKLLEELETPNLFEQ